VGSRRDCRWILGLSGFRVVAMDERASGQLVIRIERRGVRRYTCSGCGRRTGRCGRSRQNVGSEASGGDHTGTAQTDECNDSDRRPRRDGSSHLSPSSMCEWG
jgi:hypothetical protein